MRCTNCGSLAIDFADSQAVCSACGVVLEESQIVSDITFAENTAGGAVVQGSYLGADQARWNITRMATARGVTTHVAERALRFFQLALDGGTATAAGSQPKNFVLGRKSDYTVASCLYVACRMAKTTHMLIDFADVIQVNVFVLGRSYLRLLRVLNLQMPLIDPSFYISRFAALLEFGDETQRVVTDATRLVTRFKTDWMVEGRRPAGICGACLLLAARMNHFRRSVTEIVQVVKIADVTLRKRLEEFKSTPSGQLTIEDFRSVWLEEENNPPAFARARVPKATVKSADAHHVAPEYAELQAPTEQDASKYAFDGEIERLADQATEQEINLYLQQDDIRALDSDLSVQERMRLERAKSGHVVAEQQTEALEQPEQEGDGSLDGLDESELDNFILSEEEVKIKERVWMEFNKDYLEAALARQLKLEADQKAGIAPTTRNRKRQKPRDGTTAPTKSAAESAKQMMLQKRWSRRINYDVLNSLFPGGSDAQLGSKNTSHDKRNNTTPPLSENEESEEDTTQAKRARATEGHDVVSMEHADEPYEQDEYW
ncbi:transcription factor TFIIIB subunit brf1 [Malassezia vespertilionis]|uniref:transcription factor TFIIIB subunit brf1 n=1 Tax=Malassezia vespertilionis TaxID=2020962 RepID=UPI0024B0F506|nr:transcription factor TFIIIB subunit brf1 [Malassezia vespertilionis]WFD07143.1 transcription factor TFIIIB subunit brf1 [Malassezia vespertilionis]